MFLFSRRKDLIVQRVIGCFDIISDGDSTESEGMWRGAADFVLVA